ncbi:hypothetical protein NQ318_016569 [Aromia moschata]|uniref:Uncharacterized protein n=1 Tax=Aromia moschata TaxID=1265417 RepID=A0AAV8YY31_9CUCU|nr:hypothetical protein NQ318_016569 [Aromia moschata]
MKSAAGYLKHSVYVNKPTSIDDLKNRIRYEIQKILAELIRNIVLEIESRLGYCQEVNEPQFEHLLKISLG